MTEPSEKPAKTKRGGYRPGAGRPPGRPNNSTLKKQAAVAKEVANALAAANGLDVENMSAIEVLDWVMKRSLRAGDLAGAASVAERLAPYQSPKIASATVIQPLAEDMQPDPEPTPDEDVPDLIE